MMNAPKTQLEAIKAVVPGLKSPTVVPLEMEGWVAIHTAIEEEVFWDCIEKLRAAGASEILVSPLTSFYSNRTCQQEEERLVTATDHRAASAFNPDSALRGVIRALPTYVPSRPNAMPERLIRLDMNESPYGPSPKARAALAAFDETHRYPDFAQSRLRQAISEYTGVAVEQIVCGAGLDDVLTTLANLVLDPGDEVIISVSLPSVCTESCASLHGGITVDAPLTADFQLDPDAVLAAITARTKIIIICTPNNPTGNVLDTAAIKRICAEAPVFGSDRRGICGVR